MYLSSVILSVIDMNVSIFRYFESIIRPNCCINVLYANFCNGSGSGTVKNPEGVFSDREAAFENRYFREKTSEDLENLKRELKERRKRKQEMEKKGNLSNLDAENDTQDVENKK